MNIKKIEHIGIAVHNLKKARKFYEDILGLRCYREAIIPDQKVKTVFYQIGEVKIELLESTDPDSPVARFIEKKGEGIHHIAFEISGLSDRLRELKNTGIRLIDEHPREGTEHLEIAFIHPKSTHGVLVELCENPGQT